MNTFTFQEIYSLADRIGLRVPDIDTFVDNLNNVGFLIKKGPRTYQVHMMLKHLSLTNLNVCSKCLSNFFFHKRRNCYKWAKY